MRARDRADLKNRFGERVSFEKVERQVYSHDTASLPGLVKRMFKMVTAMPPSLRNPMLSTMERMIPILMPRAIE